MSIVPLPVFEADADPRHRDALTEAEVYASLEPPKTIVVRFGLMGLIGEYRHDGDAKPGCGTKLVARTHRGTELVEMLTTTCENSGCTKSISRKEMMEYIQASGGRDFPFFTNGRVLRVATVEDLNKQSALTNDKPRYIRSCKALIEELRLDMKLVDVEPILGAELLTFFYMSEERVDFRELVKRLAAECSTRIEMRQVGARDEARLVADYERCGQHCCCKNFLKVLKPVSMKSAKVQKATLDPLKISGRCGRLMCCLRYEDQTYKELKARLPHRNKRVGTTEGPGVVVDTKILVQLALVRLEEGGREIAVPIEELMSPDECPQPGEIAREPDALRGMSARRAESRARRDRKPEKQEKQEEAAGGEGTGRKRRRRRRRRTKAEQQDAYREKAQAEEAGGGPPAETAPRAEGEGGEGEAPKRRRRRRRRRRKAGGEGGGGSGGDGGGGGGDAG
ncbi:MAG: PSP1 domain-containing protein [Planctomycetota bacterium]